MLIDGITLTDTSTIENAAVASGTSFPDGSVGEMFYRTDLDKPYMFNGTDWNLIGGASGGGGGSTTEFIASGEIASAGLAVSLNADGTVSVVTGTVDGAGASETFAYQTAVYVASVYDAGTGKIVIAYRSSVTGKAVIGTVSGDTITFGTPVVFDNTGMASYISVAYDSTAGKVVIAYQDGGNSSYGTAVVGTVSGTAISFGTPTVFESAAISWTSIAYHTAAGRVVITYADGGNSSYGTAVVGTVSGTAISFGTPTVFESANIQYISIAYDVVSGKVAIAYNDVGNSNYGTAIVGTLSGLAISFGTPVVFRAGLGYYNSIGYHAAAGRVVIAYRDGGNLNYGTAVVGIVSGTTITFGTPVVFNSALTNYPSVAYDSASGKMVIAYQDGGNANFGSAVVGTVSGTAISFGTPTVFESAATNWVTIVYDSALQKMVIAYADNGNANFGTVVVGTSVGNAISFGTPALIAPTASVYTAAAYDTAANKVVIAYRDTSNGDYGTAVVGTVSGDVITFGAPTIFEAATTNYVSIAYEPGNGKMVIAYADGGNSNYGTAIVGTVSGTSISFGTAVVFESAAVDYVSIAYNSAAKVVMVYRDQGNSFYGTAVVGTVSGTAISFGTPVVFRSANCLNLAIGYHTAAGKVVIAYADVGNSFFGTAVVGTVSGTSMTFGTPQSFRTAQVQYISLAYHTALQKMVIAYSDTGNAGFGTAVVGTVSGTAISYGTPIVYASANTYYTAASYDSALQKIVIGYYNASAAGFGTAVVGTVSGTTMSFGTPVVFNSAATQWLSSTYDSTAGKVVFTYDVNNAIGSKAVVWTSAGASNNTSTIGIAQAAATDAATVPVKMPHQIDSNQVGLTPGLNYYVTGDGSLSTISTGNVLIGKALSATNLLITNWGI